MAIATSSSHLELTFCHIHYPHSSASLVTSSQAPGRFWSLPLSLHVRITHSGLCPRPPSFAILHFILLLLDFPPLGALKWVAQVQISLLNFWPFRQLSTNLWMSQWSFNSSMSELKPLNSLSQWITTCWISQLFFDCLLLSISKKTILVQTVHQNDLKDCLSSNFSYTIN